MTHEGSYKEEEVKFADGVTIPDKIIICCGTKDSVVGQFPKSYHNLFVKNGIDHIWYEVPNADHDMNAQYSGLYNFLQFIGKYAVGVGIFRMITDRRHRVPGDIVIKTRR